VKKNLYLFELSDIFANQVYLPYSSGVVWSYSKSKQIIRDNYDLKDWFYYREEIGNILSKITEPDVLAFSCFMWNWNLNCNIAQLIKSKYPSCLIVFGGQHQPMQDRNDGFFESHPYVDILVHHEGEETFYEILVENLEEDRDFSNISGITLNKNEIEYRTPHRIRKSDINTAPSPYLDGSFDELLSDNKKGLLFSANIESARGCPFSCTFCEIGESYYNKIRTSYDKTKREIDWIAENKIEYVTDANSNYGLKFDQDYDLALYVKRKKEETGYPHAYRVTWVKGKADKVLSIAKVFEEAGAQKGMTIALQSMNQSVLKAVKRRNVDGGKLQEFIKMYEEEKIGSYVELIWGLPEETLETFKDGIMQILNYGYHNYLDIHLMMMLPNAPIASKEYIKKYGIKTTTTQPRFSHRHLDDIMSEDTVEFVTQTNSFTKDEWIEGHQYRWLMIFSHYLGPLQFISRALNQIYEIPYRSFYDNLLSFCKRRKDTFIGKEYHEVRNNLQLVLKNKRFWGGVVDGIGDINWNVDESTCIKLANGNKPDFYREIKNFIASTYPEVKPDVLNEILLYQINRLSDPYIQYPFEKVYRFNIHDVIENNAPLKREKNVVVFDSKNYNSDIFLWAKEVIWFGRRVGKYKTNAKLKPRKRFRQRVSIRTIKSIAFKLIRRWNEKSFFDRCR
jgi:putative methyltransferase